MRMSQVILAYSRLPRQLPAALRARWRARLPKLRAAQLSANARAQSQSLVGVALACRTLSAVSGRIIAPSELRYGEFGKPQVAGLPEFSIAHAGDWVLCAVSSDGAVGVDIEPLQSRAQLPAWLTVFDAHERAAARTPRAALAIWTRKEAVLKAAGGGLAELPRVQVRGGSVRFRGQRWYCRAPQIAPRVIACLATIQPVTRLRLRSIAPAALSL
jgi:4'-phosphopantetheinyl transferase